MVEIINRVSIGVNRGLDIDSFSDDNLQQFLCEDINPGQMLLQLLMVDNLRDVVLAVGGGDGHFDLEQRAE